jgi:mannose-6-phosphate isomerase-like protein (cupin superfamily)
MTTEVLRLSPNSTLEIRRSDDEALEVEATYAPGGGPPPSHLHPAQDEHFEVLEGSMQAVVDGSKRVLDAGDELDIPRGTAHQMWNSAGAPARVRWVTTPRGRTEDFFRAVDGVIPGEGQVPDVARMLELIELFDDTFRLVTE